MCLTINVNGKPIYKEDYVINLRLCNKFDRFCAISDGFRYDF